MVELILSIVKLDSPDSTTEQPTVHVIRNSGIAFALPFKHSNLEVQ